MNNNATDVAAVVARYKADILKEWVQQQREGSSSLSGVRSNGDALEQSSQFIDLFSAALTADPTVENESAWADVRTVLESVSRARAIQGFSPTETATFVLSLKQPLFQRLRQEAKSAEALGDAVWAVSTVLDSLGLYTTEVFLRSREEVIMKQQQELLDLSTPVVELFSGVLALPLIGTLDSERTHSVMENLLEGIVEHEAAIAIIDITGVPTVDTLVAQHLIKTIAAARLMGAECIISGIRPQIAQTIVHLGVDLGDVTTKASLADALRLALAKLGRGIAPLKSSTEKS
ncbi:STAS domain-containing protein [Uliginosibacterium sp. H1]|uniref:STAS domain-containing protein n=1 Tax=Uliginosibacterium sp. H1 TaxID=3114757 RepID=UPI002E19940D|nr:STAS domain-containing protein [Uliginosibacterium sp. H1]